jgi:hypothetical protein
MVNDPSCCLRLKVVLEYGLNSAVDRLERRFIPASIRLLVRSNHRLVIPCLPLWQVVVALCDLSRFSKPVFSGSKLIPAAKPMPNCNVPLELCPARQFGQIDTINDNRRCLVK